MPVRPAHIFALFCSLALAIFGAGCASYQLGSSAELPFERLYIEPVSNDSYAPQAQVPVSAKIRDVILRDGRVKLVSKAEDADAVLSVNLTEYTRTGNTRQSEDTGRAQDFVVSLEAEVSLTDVETGKHYFKDITVNESTYAFEDDPYREDVGSFGTQSYFNAERQAMPVLARGLSRKIADTVLSNW